VHLLGVAIDSDSVGGQRRRNRLVGNPLQLPALEIELNFRTVREGQNRMIPDTALGRPLVGGDDASSPLNGRGLG
jgi:hypothetical protein